MSEWLQEIFLRDEHFFGNAVDWILCRSIDKENAMSEQWSSEKPTKSGWYWWQSSVMPEPEVIQLNTWMLSHRVKDMCCPGTKWAGPLESPGEE
jgi:hypothetical protein